MAKHKSLTAKRIRSRRLQTHMTQLEVARRVGIMVAQYAHYEQGVYKPKAELLSRIADALGCSLDYLTGRAESPRGATVIPLDLVIPEPVVPVKVKIPVDRGPVGMDEVFEPAFPDLEERA